MSRATTIRNSNHRSGKVIPLAGVRRELPNGRPKRRVLGRWLRLLPYLAIVAIIAALQMVRTGWDPIPVANAIPGRVTMPLCSSPKRYHCVVDGDTVWVEGEKMRLRGINAPETGSPKCRREAHLGRKAAERLRELLNETQWTVSRHGFDRYGRTLVDLKTVDGTIGDRLVHEGLAHRWKGHKESWC